MSQKNDLTFYDLSAAHWWEKTAKIYALYHLNSFRFDYFARYQPHWQDLKVLDVGCGGGYSCEFMAALGAVVSGIDQSQNCIAKATEHAANKGFAINYRQGWAENLPYPDNSFDVVICVDVLEHVTALKPTIAEIYRVLKPGGFFGFDTINRTFKSKLIMIWLLENILQEIPQGIHDWQKFIKPEELTNLLEQTGFYQVEMSGFNLFGTTLLEQLKAYWRYQKTKDFSIKIDSDTSVMYIGKAQKPI